MLYGANNGLFEGSIVEKTKELETGFVEMVERDHGAVLTEIETKKELTDEVVAELDKAIADFKAGFPQFYATEEVSV